MADVQPLRAIHYDLATAGPLDRLAAPPYDVIDADLRRELAVAQPAQRGRDRPSRRATTPTRHAGELFEQWQMERSAGARPRAGAVGADADLPRPGRHASACATGFFCRVRITDYGPGLIRPHERTHPAAKEDRLRADARDAREPLPDLLALQRPRRRCVVGARAGHRGGAVGRGDRRRRHRAPAVAHRGSGGDRARPGGARRRRAADRRRPPPLRDRAHVRARRSAARATTTTC